MNLSILRADDDMDDTSSQEDGMEALLEKIPHIKVPRVEMEIKIDGKLDETAWLMAEKIDLKFESYPALMAAAPVKTHAQFLISDNNLYISFIAQDPDPDKIQAPLRDRDAIELDDYVGVALDPDGKRMRSYEFYVSASGVQADWVRNSVEDKRTREWDADWESASQKNETGYSVEMRIPLGTVDLPNDATHRLMIIKRHYPREIRHYLTSVAMITPYQGETDTGNNQFKIIPAITLNPEWSRDIENGENYSREENFELGADLEYRFSPSWGMDLTINPNYLEVEADLTSTSINDPFTSLTPEKRPFFVKESDVFGTPYDLVYTRNIEDPGVGFQFGGSEGKWVTGNFLVHDRELSVIVPGNLGSERAELDVESTSGAFRVRHDRKNGESVGLMGTLRDAENGYHNYVAGADFLKKLGSYHTFRGQWLYSDTRYSEDFTEDLYDPPDDLDPAEDTGIPGETGFSEQVLRADPGETISDDAWQLSYKYEPRAGYVTVLYRDAGEDFRGDLGYIPLTDYRQGILNAGVNKYFETGSAGVSRIRLSSNVYKMESQAGEEIMSGGELWFNYWGLYQSWFRLGYRNRDRVARRFNQQELSIDGNATPLNEEQWIVRVENALAKNVRFTIAGRFGSQIDTDNYRLGNLVELEPEIRWNINDRVELNIQNTYRTLDIADGQVFRENYLRLSMIYQLEKGSFLRLTLIDDYNTRNQNLYLYEEQDDEERDSSLELLFAIKPSQLNTFFMGLKTEFSEYDLENASGLRDDEFSIFLKYSRAFQVN
ncbi:carbohydrate binding family 9 domain-containing protein [Kiritimatiellaeota bacterium B1221]|nr:carbohydrate binding family 9 domain-containing protein [Kiritimatiellaeota bacterium B1221]